MAIADLIAEYNGIAEQVAELTQVRDAYKQQLADLQNQIDTANLQHQSDQQAIADLQAKYDADELALTTAQKEVANADAAVAEARALVQAATAQLTSLQSVKVYDGLEYKQFAQNSKAQVGGSGIGTSGMVPASATGMAKIWIKPGPRPDPTKANYFDVYDTEDEPLDDAITRWKMENTFIFATQADADAANCLELEARQVLKDGSMYVAGTQLNFGSNTFRYWDHVKKWTPSGAPCPKFLAGNLYHASVEGHRDATTIYHDAISLNDLRIPLTVSYPSWKESPIWRQMLRCAIQLDAKDTAFEVVIGQTKFTVSN